MLMTVQHLQCKKKRMEQLVLVDLKGKLDAEVGKQVKQIIQMHCKMQLQIIVALYAGI
jgi:hypothetical protein